MGSLPERYIDLANKAPLSETELDVLPSGLSLKFQVAGLIRQVGGGSNS